MRPSREILDTVDPTINSDAPLLQGLTNGGPSTLGESMPLGDYQPQRNTGGVFGNTPLTNELNNNDWDEEWQDTDPMSFSDDDIFEEAAFLGVRLGKKAKAKGAAKKAARQARRAQRRASKQSEIDNIGANSIWKQPNEITPETYTTAQMPGAEIPAAASNASMLETLNDPNSTFNVRSLLAQAGGTGFENANTQEYGLNGEDDLQSPKSTKKNTMLYIGIGIAVVIVLIVAFKSRK